MQKTGATINLTTGAHNWESRRRHYRSSMGSAARYHQCERHGRAGVDRRRRRRRHSHGRQWFEHHLYGAPTESTPAMFDTVTNFHVAVDRIDLSGSDRRPCASRRASFSRRSRRRGRIFVVGFAFAPRVARWRRMCCPDPLGAACSLMTSRSMPTLPHRSRGPRPRSVLSFPPPAFLPAGKVSRRTAPV
jgi:hypothetical protein